MWTGFSLLMAAAIFAFYKRVIKPRQQQKNEAKIIPFEEQDDAYSKIASRINKAIDRTEFEALWGEADSFNEKYGGTAYGFVDYNSLKTMLIDREMIVNCTA